MCWENSKNCPSNEHVLIVSSAYIRIEGSHDIENPSNDERTSLKYALIDIGF